MTLRNLTIIVSLIIGAILYSAISDYIEVYRNVMLSGSQITVYFPYFKVGQIVSYLMLLQIGLVAIYFLSGRQFSYDETLLNKLNLVILAFAVFFNYSILPNYSIHYGVATFLSNSLCIREYMVLFG